MAIIEAGYMRANLFLSDAEIACKAGRVHTCGVQSAMNTLAHCFEALYSKLATPDSTVLAQESLRMRLHDFGLDQAWLPELAETDR